MPRSISPSVSVPPHTRNVIQRRGFAMVLVMIALGTATVLTVSNMASKNSSRAIGDNAASAVEANWSAKSAADIGVAILQTNLNWRAAITDGSLITNQPIAGGNVSITFTNLAGALPTSQDQDLVMTVKSNVGGVDSTIQKIVHVTPPTPPASAVDVGLTEFTIFANNSVNIAPDGVIGVWSKSPAALSSTPAKIGLGFTTGADYQIAPSASIVRTALFVPSDASVGVESELDDARWAGGAKLPVHLPAIAKLIPSNFASLPHVSAKVDINNKAQSLAPGYYKKVIIKNGSVVTLDASAGTQQWAFRTLKIEHGSVLIIKGDVQIRIDDDLRVKNKSAIELATPASKLFAVVYDNVNIDNSVVGFDRSVGLDPNRSRDGSYAYVDPRRIAIFAGYRTTPDATGDRSDDLDRDFGDVNTRNQEFRIKNKSLVAASIYAPLAEVEVEKSGTLFGRVTASELDVKSNGAVLGDPALDSGVGFTTLDGPLYTATGAPVPGLAAALASTNIAAGDDAAQAAVVAAVTAANSSSSVTLGMSLGRATPRKQSRAIARDWPVRAMAMESDTTPPASGDFKGSFHHANNVPVPTLGATSASTSIVSAIPVP